MTTILQSHIAGQWVGRAAAQVLRSAINGKPVASTHADQLDFGAAVDHARRVGVPNLLKLDFQQRAERLKALAKPLTMLLFGMVNWMFTWMKPGGALDHDAMAPVVADLFLGGLGAVKASKKETTT